MSKRTRDRRQARRAKERRRWADTAQKKAPGAPDTEGFRDRYCDTVKPSPRVLTHPGG